MWLLRYVLRVGHSDLCIRAGGLRAFVELGLYGFITYWGLSAVNLGHRVLMVMNSTVSRNWICFNFWSRLGCK